MQYFNQDKLLELTDGGRLIIEAYYPDSIDSFLKPSRKFKCRETEKTASASLKQKAGVWLVTDFGGDSKTRNAIGVVMLEENLTFPQAIEYIVKEFKLETGEAQRPEAKADIFKAPATEGQEEGKYYYKVKPKFSIADARHIIADKVWSYLRELAPKDSTPEEKDAYAIEEANSVFKRYNFFCLDSYILVKDREAITIQSNENFPIYLFDNKDCKKIYKPNESNKGYRFQYVLKPKDEYIFGYQQAAAAHQDLIDVEAKEDDDPKKDPPKLSEIILCTGGSDALNVAMLGYEVVWLNSETAKFSTGQFKKLAAIADKVYNLPDIDKTGKREAYRLGMMHLDMYTLYLPEELKLRKDWRGNPCKDVRDFFKYKTAYDFRELFKVAYPYRFWDEQKQFNKSGEFTGMQYVPNNVYLMSFLADNGFYRYKTENEKEGYIYVQIMDNIVREVKPKDIRDYVNNFLLSRYMDVRLRNAFYRTAQLNEGSISSLPYIEIDFTDHSKGAQWMFFRNKTLKITAEGIEEIKPKDTDKYVWEDEVKQHNFKKLEDSFVISYDAETKEWDIEIKNTDSVVLRYLINGSRMFWREELENRLDGIPEADRERYIETYGLTDEHNHFLSAKTEDYKKKYLEDHKWDIAGPLLTANEKKEQKQHLINKLFIIGFHLHAYKNHARAWCSWVMDNRIAEGSESLGGSGKSLLFKLLAEYLKTEFIGARNQKITEDQHIFGNLTRHHDFIFVDDCNQYLKFDFFFPSITGPIDCNPKNTKKFTISFADAAKIGFASNYPPFGVDQSADRRIIYGIFSDYYHPKGTEYREDRRVYDDFGIEFITDFSEAEWNLTSNLFAQCVKLFLSTDVKIGPPMSNVVKRNMKAEMGDVFHAWADVYFSAESDRLNKEFQRSIVFSDFTKATKVHNWSPQRFLKSMKAWCTYYGFTFNPKEMITDHKTNRIIKNIMVLDPVSGKEKKETEEFWYIQVPKTYVIGADGEAEDDLPLTTFRDE